MNTKFINHWNKLFSLPKATPISEDFAKRILVATQFNLIGFFASLFFVGLGWYLRLNFLNLLNLSLAIAFACLFYLKILGYYRLYLFCFLVLINLATFLLASYFGNSGGGYLYFFPIVVINFYFFRFVEKKRLLVSLSFSFLLLLIIQITEYSLFFIPRFSRQVVNLLFNINLWISLLFVLYWINYLFKENFITAQKLISEKNHIKAILDNSLQTISMIDKNYQLVAFNRRQNLETLKYFGKSMKIGDWAFEYIHPEYRSPVKEKMDQAFAGEEQYTQNHIDLDGERIWYEIKYTPIVEENLEIKYIIFSTLDITARHKAEKEAKKLLDETQRLNEELLASEEELRQTLDHTLELNRQMIQNQQRLVEAQQIAKLGSWEMNLSTQKTTYTEEFFRILDIMDLETMQKFDNPFAYVYPEDNELVNSIIKEYILLKKDFKTQHRIITAQGKIKYVETIGIFVFEDNKAVKLHGTTQDITADKNSKELLQNKNQELEKLNQELDSFVYSVSHDLRAPLASVLGLINLLKEEINATQALLYLELMQKSIHKLDIFIRSVTDYSRNNRLEIQSELIHFQDIITDISENFKYMEGAKNIQVNLDIRENTPFFSDENRLRIILNNLISNAFKYHNPQESEQSIKIKVRTYAQNAQIIIQDNGIGIAQEYLNKIFDMFYRASQHSTGSGLGLYIVKQTLDKLKGKIEAKSKLGEGTTFTIEIPNLKNS